MKEKLPFDNTKIASHICAPNFTLTMATSMIGKFNHLAVTYESYKKGERKVSLTVVPLIHPTSNP